MKCDFPTCPYFYDILLICFRRSAAFIKLSEWFSSVLLPFPELLQ